MQTKLYVVLQTLAESLDKRTMDGYLCVSLLCLVLIQTACCLRKDDPSPCNLPKQPGPCKAYNQRFFYDAADGTCKPFVYGGCHGNENNFPSKPDCEQRCLAGNPPAVQKAEEVTILTTPNSRSLSGKDYVCQLPAQSGLCLAYIPSYFFNSQVGECEEFIYGGCGGNENRFATKQECENYCRSLPPARDVCHLPKAEGMCKAYFPSFFYNSVTGECEFFVYGGCDGNGNRFDTLAACEERCRATTIETTTETVRVDTSSSSAPNNSPCTQPAVGGPCRARFTRWHFDSASSKCRPFYYGGCRGNSNNFMTQADCQRRCSRRQVKNTVTTSSAREGVLAPAVPSTSGNRCMLPVAPGPCEAYIPSFYFDSQTGQCRDFVYGGCQGNANRFAKIEQCREACESGTKKQPAVCSQPKIEGPCFAALPRFYYNQSSGQCESFLYGGCSGNQNNFLSYEDCVRTCQH